MLVVACASAGNDPDANAGAADAPLISPDANNPDDASTIDAPPGSPDAMAAVDAPPGTPDASVPDAMLPPDAMVPDAAGCTLSWVELLQNPGFESGDTVWNTTTNAGTVIRMQGGGLPWAPHAGAWASILGGANDAVQTMSQQFTVPASATALRFRSYECFVTEETAVVTEWDTLDIELQTTGGTTLESLAHLSNLDAGTTCAWTVSERTATASYAGQTIQLNFAVVTDFSNISTFGFDTLAVEAFACP